MYYLLISVFFVCVSYYMYMKTDYRKMAIFYLFCGICICPAIMLTIPLDGYYEAETERINISDSGLITGTGKIVTSEDNEYVFIRESVAEYMSNDLYETYITEELSHDVTVEKTEFGTAEVVVHTSKPKIKVLGWTFPILGENKVKYVFFIPENASIKEMKIR